MDVGYEEMRKYREDGVLVKSMGRGEAGGARWRVWLGVSFLFVLKCLTL